MTDFRFGFRVVGGVTSRRRLVDHSAALCAYAACDSRAEVDREGYVSLYQYTYDFRDHLEAERTTRGFEGPCWASWLWWDVDRGGDLDAGTRDARRLAAGIVDRFRIGGDELLIFFSGAKGYHIGIPTALWLPTPGLPFASIARSFAVRQAEASRVSIDMGVYDNVRLFRAPNSRHPRTGLHKRRVGFDELLGLSVEAILRLAECPEPFDWPDLNLCRPTIEQLNQHAAQEWAAARANVEAAATARAEWRNKKTEGATLNRLTLKFIRDGAEVGDRHRLLFSAAANLAEFGCPRELAHALLNEVALDSGLPPSEVRRQIDCGLAHVGRGATHG